MSTARVLRYRDVEVPRQEGEVGRLRVLKGSNEGMIYVVKSSSVTVGRGEECDVIIGDLKASRKHIKIDYTAQGWLVTDLGSSNGIYFQGEYVRKFALSSGQHFTIGDTIFEFFASSEETQMLMAPLRPVAEVIQLDSAMAAQRAKVQNLSQAVKVAAPKKKTNPMLLLAVAGVACYLFQDDIIPLVRPVLIATGFVAPQAPRKVEAKKEEETKVLPAYLPPDGMTAEVGKTAEQYYRQGFREFREGNYLRAKAQYELALEVNPNHQLARKGLENADHSIEVEVKRMMNGAETAIAAGRMKEAKGYYETAMRLLYFDRSNPDYIECEEAAKKINEELKKGY